jgi:hypothetical protein
MSKKLKSEKPIMNSIPPDFINIVRNNSLIRRELLQKILNGEKDIDFECNYPAVITINEYKKMYDREGVGTRVVEVYPEECWQTPPEVYEVEDADEKTEFEQKVEELNNEKELFTYLQKIDVQSGIGQFGVLLIGIDDGLALNEPVEGIDLNTGKGTGDSERKLLYLKPFDESCVTIKTSERDTKSPRYGLPTMYTIQFKEAINSSSVLTTLDVHWTRVLHVADGTLSNEVLGTPRMKRVYNRLLDIRKILGGSAEMFWRGGYPGMSFETSPDVEAANLDTESIKDEMEKYVNGLSRYFANTGITVKQLSPTVADPSSHLEQQIKYICITLGIPYRIFQGSEAAQLASGQDRDTWNGRVSKRQSSYVTSRIIRPFFDRLIAMGVLPEVEEYFVEWPKLDSLTATDKSQIAVAKTNAMAGYISGGVSQLVGRMSYLTLVLGFTQDEARAMLEEAVEDIEEETAGSEELPNPANPLMQKNPKEKPVEEEKEA